MLTCLFATLMFTMSPAADMPSAYAQAPASSPDSNAKDKEQKKETGKKSDTPAPDGAVKADAGAGADQVETGRGGGGTRFTWGNHPSLRVGRVFRLDFQAKFQEDVRDTYVGEPAFDRADLHRNRIGIQGHVFGDIEYEVERELTEKELDPAAFPKSAWKDVFVNVTYIKNAQVKAGKFKIPFGLDQLTGVANNDFVYRSLGATYLSPARDVGLMVHGSFLRHGLEYWTGVFKHDGDNARSSKIQGGDETLAGRVVGTPFRAVTRNRGEIALGTSFTVSKLTDDSFRPNGLRGRTIMTQHVFYEPVYVKGQRRRWGADVDWTVGPASARAEYTYVSDERRQQGLGDQNLPNARARSWFVSGTWLLTGDEKRRPVRPKGELLQGGWGAVEVGARYERLWFDSVGGTDEPFRHPRAETIMPAGERIFTVGVNWTLNRFIKLQLNGIREHVEDIERNPVPGSGAFWSRIVRLQFVL